MVEDERVDNTVYVGKKRTMDYVFAVQTQAQMYEEVIVKARGKNISKAVDVAEISKNRFLKDWQIGSINVGTDNNPRGKDLMEGQEDRVSFIALHLRKVA